MEILSGYFEIWRYCPGILRYGAHDSVGASALLDQRSWCPGKREQQQQDMTSAKSCNLAEMKGFLKKIISDWNCTIHENYILFVQIWHLQHFVPSTGGSGIRVDCHLRR